MSATTETSTIDALASLGQDDAKELALVNPDVIGAVVRGEVDMQIATAKKYPRSLARFMTGVKQLVTLDEDTAESMFYALPRDGKTIDGPSARFAEVVANAWGNMRVQARVVAEEEQWVISRGEAWDLETNVGIAYEVRRRIVDNRNRRYKADMIGTTSNAASSIALRNAILKIVPSAIWRPLYLEARKVAVGTQETLGAKREKLLRTFLGMGVQNSQVFEQLGVKVIEEITLDHLATMRGLFTALKEGETTLEQAFPSKVSPKAKVDAPEGYDAYLAKVEAAAAVSPEELTKVFAAGTELQRDYLSKHNNAAWEQLKVKAMEKGSAS